jgi:hypothetical protein
MSETDWAIVISAVVFGTVFTWAYDALKEHFRSEIEREKKDQSDHLFD